MRRAQRRWLRWHYRGSWGGRRPGAGRKPKGSRPGTSHKTRPSVSRRHPLHLTMRVRRGVGSLRRRRCLSALEKALWGGSNRFGFRLNHFSVRRDRVYLIAEADGKKSVSRGMQGMAVRVARSLNKALQRKGAVFVE